MGESDPQPNPIFIVIMRNSRGKLFVYVAVLGVLCFIVFLLSSTHTSLKELEGVNEKCQQQRDSLSAQLQVVYEHKNRLEKSLQQEKTDHRHTKEESEKQNHDLEAKWQEEKDRLEKLEAQISQFKTRYSELEEEKAQSENALTEQLKAVQAQKDKEIEKLQNHISELLSEKDKLEMSNNANTWKLEQQASEISLCNLQREQVKADFAKCQAQFQKYESQRENYVRDIMKKSPSEKTEIEKAESNHTVQEKHKKPEVSDQKDQQHVNKTLSGPVKEKPSVLAKPNILAANNAADGVLPKPMNIKENDVDAAIEDPDVKKTEFSAKGNEIAQNNIDNKLNPLNNEKNGRVDAANKDQENHPQVLPPSDFDIGDKDDHAAERGEYGIQYGIADAKHQVEVPVFNSKPNVKRKNFMPLPQQVGNNNDVADEQVQDMMNKSPGEVDNKQGGGAIEEKIKEFRNANVHRIGDPNHVVDDKNYEEEDDDRENDDEQGNGIPHDVKGMHMLQDHDFDDQENQENVDNAKEEEGVVVAPK